MSRTDLYHSIATSGIPSPLRYARSSSAIWSNTPSNRARFAALSDIMVKEI